jgi:hypothetical protein
VLWSQAFATSPLRRSPVAFDHPFRARFRARFRDNRIELDLESYCEYAHSMSKAYFIYSRESERYVIEVEVQTESGRSRTTDEVKYLAREIMGLAVGRDTYDIIQPRMVSEIEAGNELKSKQVLQRPDGVVYLVK